MNKGDVLIIGAGFLGKNLISKLQERNYSCLVSTSKDQHSPFYLDLTKKESIEIFSQKIKQIQGVIFTAGKEPSENLDLLSWEHLNEMTMIHLSGIIWCVKHLSHKISQGGFCIFTSSVAARRGSYDPVYSSMKAGIEGLTRTLSRELSNSVRVNCISPGLIQDSPVFEKMTPDFRDKHLTNTPLGKFCTVEDVSNSYLFAIENQSLTGQIIQINGGQVFG